MNKLIRDGKVAVLVSGDYGAGWSTWNHDYPELLFEPTVAEMVLDFQKASQDVYGDDYKDLYDRYYQAVESYIVNNVQIDYKPVYTGGISGLTVEWVPVGDRFRIREYDGAETLVLESNEQWITA